MEYIISIFFQLYSYFRIFMCFVGFTYFYKHFFDTCIVEKECVFVSKKTNKKKIKKVEMSKKLLSFIYFILVCLLYSYMNFNVFVCFTSILVIFILRMCQKYDESLIDVLFIADKSFIIKTIYFGFYWLCKFIFFIFGPLYKRLETKKNNNYDSVKNLFVNKIANTEYGGILPLFGLSNDKQDKNDKNDDKNNEGIGNIMNIFGDLGELQKLFEDTKSSSKHSSNTEEPKNKITDPKWLKRSSVSSTENLDKYILSNIASNKDFKKITNIVNDHNIDQLQHNKKDSKKYSKNSEVLVNLYKKMNDVFATISTKK